MAKSKSFFGLRTGSTKTLTFQVNNGKQITKDRVEIVKNPRTQSQMVQRMIMATASAAYAAMREIANHSFEGTTYGQPCMSKFISINAKLLANNLAVAGTSFAYNKYQDRGLVPGAYQLAKGSLPTPSFTYSASSGEGSISITLNPTGLTSGYTANDLGAALGLQVGEMATICMIFGNAAANGWNFGFVRVKFLQSGTVALTAANLADYFQIESSIGEAAVTVNTTSLVLAYSDVDIADTSAIARCVIYSRNSANGWLRSDAIMTIPAGMVVAPTAADAIATYPVGADYILNGGNF